MKKAFDQTVRDLKRGVNKKVLKVPGIEQKVLDATSNEPWGPHGSLLADIAHASRNYHEYQMIMSVLWKRINDTGKNWRHVYKALTALEYLVAHGSERVTDEIKEHAYQISTLSRFHYIDSNGRDQGNNVRKKSQNLVDLVNDKERISEVRQKAATNRDKFRSMPSGMYRPGDRYDDERNEGQYMDDDRNGSGYGRERDYNYRYNDGYGKYGDLYSRDGDRYGRDNEDRYSQESYRDDDYQGRSRTYDGYSSRSRSADRDRDRGDNDDAQFSSRGSGGRADEQSQNGRGLERKYSEQNIGAPPSYEEAVGDSRSPAYSERNGENPAASVPESVSPPAPQAAAPSPRVTSPSAPKAASLTEADNTSHEANPFGPSASSPGQETEVFDEFDPRNPFRAGSAVTAAPTNPSIPTTSSNAEMELLGSLSDSFSGNPLATVPTTSEADVQPKFSGSEFGATQSASNPVSQSFEDPFGEAPFRAFPSQDTSLDPQQSTVSALPFQPTASPNVDQFNAIASKPDTANNFGFGDSISATTYSGSNAYSPPTNLQFSPQDMSASSQETDILAGVLPPPGPSHVVPQAGFSVPMGQTTAGQLDCGAYGGFNPQAGSAVPTNAGVGPQALQYSGGTFVSQGGSAAPSQSNMHPATPAGAAMHFNNGNFLPQHGSPFPAMPQNNGHSATGQGPQFTSANFAQPSSMNLAVSKVSNQNLAAQPSQNGNDVFGGFFSQGSSNPVGTPAGVPSYTGALAIVPQPSKDNFETKSTVWKDTLSRGLVNLNISGPKTNPLSDIGIDFDALNRREKRMEKQTTPAVTSTITMGKAMGSGSGIGRAGASTLRPQTSMMNPGMNMGTGMGGVPGAGMGYGGVLPGMGMNMGMNPGMGMNMRMAQGAQMRPQAGYVPGSTMPGGYNPIMGMSGYTPQQPYGGGYHQ